MLANFPIKGPNGVRFAYFTDMDGQHNSAITVTEQGEVWIRTLEISKE
ncbi:hypothetical protein [Paenibacillus sp. Soil787]|nr:hypothetical protein [Paenibacillus sp. Soil787]